MRNKKLKRKLKTIGKGLAVAGLVGVAALAHSTINKNKDFDKGLYKDLHHFDAPPPNYTEHYTDHLDRSGWDHADYKAQYEGEKKDRRERHAERVEKLRQELKHNN